MIDKPNRNRRHIVRGLAAGALLTSTGCVSVANRVAPEHPRAYSRKPWAAPNVSMDAVIRVVVGHRPFRPTGFRVERERLDDKTVVHNYGHGGGGLSLGWGSSGLAVREVSDLTPGAAAVMGSGIMGLCTARLLQDAGWSVTIYTRDVYRHTTSNVAAGEWGPFSTHDKNQVDAAFLARLDWAARVSHHAYTSLTGARYGIRWLEGYVLNDGPFADSRRSSFDDLFAYRAYLEPGEHPFGNRYTRRSVTMQIDPGTLLRQLTDDVHNAGGKFVIRNFETLDDVLALPEPVVFNCTGLGAAALFDDAGMVPAKGQLVFLPPDPAVDYLTLGGGRGLLYMFPRSDVLLLGGTFRYNDSSSNIEVAETERIVEEHKQLFASFG